MDDRAARRGSAAEGASGAQDLGGPAEYPDLPPLTPESFERIARLIYSCSGIRLSERKAYFVVGRLGPLYRTLGCNAWEDLCERLAGAGRELIESLVDAVVTGETQFFRDQEPFEALVERIVPETVARSGRPAVFRVWSAGCSTGQEPYSIALCLWDAVVEGEVDLRIWATDICKAALDKAQRGIYGPLELARGLGPEVRKSFFEELPGGAARVRSDIRDRIRFEPLNLWAQQPSPSEGGFHAVFCRNVAIYFDRKGKRRVYEIVGRTVLPGGYLILGAAETLLPVLPGFETIHFGKSLLFRKGL